MKVLQVGKFYYPDKGGIETVARQLQIEVSSRGHTCDVLCSNSRPQTFAKEVGNSKIVKVASLGVFKSVALSPSYFSQYLKMVNDYDVIHIHCPNPLGDICSLLTPKHIPVVLQWHSDIHGFGMLYKAYRPILKKSVKRANAIIGATANHLECSDLGALFKGKSKIVPYWIEKKETSHIITKGSDYILAIGRLVPYKGFDLLIESMKKVSKKLVIVGDGPLRDELQEVARKNGVLDKVVFKGSVSEEEKSDLLRNCYFVVMSSVSKKEMFGVVQLEAFQYSKPVLSTIIPGSGVQLVNKHLESGWSIPFKNQEALSDMIEELCLDSQKVYDMGMSAKKYFDEKFQTSSSVDSLIELYSKLVSK